MKTKDPSEALDALTAKVVARRQLPPPDVARKIRQIADASLGDVGAATGVSRQAVSAWELGRRQPRGETAVRYAEVLAELKRAATE
jgi:DNA-binding XRE family transcriptional regulator